MKHNFGKVAARLTRRALGANISTIDSEEPDDMRRVKGLINLPELREYKHQVSQQEYIGLLVQQLRQAHSFVQGYASALSRDESVMAKEVKTPISTINTVADFLSILDEIIDYDLELFSEILQEGLPTPDNDK